MKPLFALLILPIAILAGCGGGSKERGQVAGVITDGNGNPVRGATVYVGVPGKGPETLSNSEGIYMLNGVTEGNQTIRATVTKDGVRYYGQNVGQIFSSERTMNVNIAVVRDDQLATVRGSVRDRSGGRIQGAKVFAYGNALTSSVAITNELGEYTIGGLWAGVNYTVSANARFYNSDLDNVNLFAGETRTLNFVLADGTDPVMPAPTGLDAVIWTSPRETTRSPGNRATYAAIRQMLKPNFKPAASQTRLSDFGNWIQTDLAWNPVSTLALLGYGIHRGTNATGPLPAIDFMRETEAAYYSDHDDRLVENVDYHYYVTSLSVQYPQTANSQSNPSNRATVRALGDLRLLDPTFGPLNFRWFAANGAQSYAVYLFSSYPSIATTSIWNTDGARTAGTFQQYTGSPLVSGRRYWYIVVGYARSDTAITISPVADFVMP